MNSTTMAKSIFFMLFLLFYISHQYPQSSESHIQPSLVKIQQLLLLMTNLNLHLNATPTATTNDDDNEFCSTGSSSSTSISLPNSDPNPSLTLVCYDNTITQLHVTGQHSFPTNFSTISFFSALASALPALKVLSLVSLGLRGPLPGPVLATSLSSLEILNISSNHLNGNIPFEISYLHNLRTLILDHNCFTGRVPPWLPSLPFLTVASFKNNSLTGTLPNSITRSQSLRILVLSFNRLSGEVPSGFRNLTNLQVLDLERNVFGPRFPILHNKLITLVLRRNRFRFGIPVAEDLRSFYQLQKLDISLNELTGPFSPSLLSLPSLAYLDISGNKLSGMLFENVSCSDQLAFVNLSSNRLTGELPGCLREPKRSSGKRRVVLYDGNCLTSREGQGQEKQQKRPHNSFCHNEALAVKIIPRDGKERRPFHKAVFAASMVGGLVGGIALFSTVFLVIRKDYFRNSVSKTPQTRIILEQVSPAYTMKLLTDARYISETMKLGSLGTPPYRTFVLDEIKEATNNLHASTLIGNGSHGSLYKGQLTDGTLVAIRSMKMKKRQSIQTYTHQIELISKLRHSHLVSSIGHCFECYPDDSIVVSNIFLVFEFVPNGTLRDSISGSRRKFSWTQRLAAAIGVARGVQILHTRIVPSVFSKSIKITDILLDHNLHVKINIYNLPLLAKTRGLVGAGVSSTGSRESKPRSFNYEDKDGVYDLGVILLEIIVGRAIISENDCSIAKDLLQVSIATDCIARRSIVDPAVHKECSDESLKTVMELCIRCLSGDPTDRPSVEDVLWNLQFASQVQDSHCQDSQSQSYHGSPVLCITE